MVYAATSKIRLPSPSQPALPSLGPVFSSPRCFRARTLARGPQRLQGQASREKATGGRFISELLWVVNETNIPFVNET